MKEQEQAYAIQEGHRNKAENEYFDARPQIDSGDRRSVFDAGFDRGYLAASTPLLERIEEMERKLNRIAAAFHVNMLRCYPDKTHEEIVAEIDKEQK